MKLASYLKGGAPSFGVLVGDGLVSLPDKLEGRAATLKQALTACLLDEIARIAAAHEPEQSVTDTRFLPLMPDPGKLLCVGLNYHDHLAEVGAGAKGVPGFFVRVPDGLLAHGDDMLKPIASDQLDFEGELAVVVGRAGRHIREDRALDHVAGYTCFIDGSVRDFQQQSTGAGKNFMATAPFGPWLVTADEIPDPSRLIIETRLNGTVMQRSGLGKLIHSIPKTISYISKVMELKPGDVIATGTPSGSGMSRKPPVWMKEGDRLEVEISGIGILRTQVRNEPAHG